VGSQQVGLEVLQGLQKLDQIGYLRFASVYKDFQEVGDFERELGRLLPKKVAAKPRSR
jgi:transcriptional repressor NrdR